MGNHLTTAFYGLKNHPEFIENIQKAVNCIDGQIGGIYTGDNLFTYQRNLSFLDDKKLMKAFHTHTENEVEKSLLWRFSTILWGVRNGLRLEGDFIECACYKGTTVRVICDTVNFAQYEDRHYYLYDLFDHDPSLPHHAMEKHSEHLYNSVKKRFSDLLNITITSGKVPGTLEEASPQKIAFMHLDLNNADAEIGVLELLFERMVPGAILVLDDYGWLGYREQKLAEDKWLEERGYSVLELPTGQGLVVK